LSAALLWTCGTPNRIAAGIALGLIASVKPQLVIMAPALLLFKRDWRAFCAAAITYLAAVATSLLLYGPEAWQSWFASMPNFHAILLGADRFGMAVSPAFAAELSGLPPLPFMLAGAAVGIVLVWTARNSSTPMQCAAITAGSLLSSPYAMVYDLAAIVPYLVLAMWEGSMIAAVAATGAVSALSLPLAAIQILKAKVQGAALLYGCPAGKTDCSANLEAK
jgi:hypothetical protein